MASSNLNGQPSLNFAPGRLDPAQSAQLQQMQMQMLLNAQSAQAQALAMQQLHAAQAAQAQAQAVVQHPPHALGLPFGLIPGAQGIPGLPGLPVPGMPGGPGGVPPGFPGLGPGPGPHPPHPLLQALPQLAPNGFPPPPLSQTNPMLQANAAALAVAQQQQAQNLAARASVPPPQPQRGGETKRCEIYKYNSTRPLFAAAWSVKKNERFRLAVGSLVEREQQNKIYIIQLDENSGQLVEKGSFNHEHPANCMRFIPDPENNYPDLLATSADYLRIHRLTPEGIVRPNEDTVLTSNKSAHYTAPLTSFDWNDVDPRLIGTASIDTTCTIFDLEVGIPIASIRPFPMSFNVKTQLIAHDKPVHDIGFSKVNHGRDHFATVGADGSCRMFDLRNLEHSTIVYEDPHKMPLMRLAWNKVEPFHLATYAQDSTEVVIIDIRVPCNPLNRLKNHTAAINGIAWAPHSSHHICTAGDDAQALIWDVSNMHRPVEDPILAYSAGGEVNQVHWGSAHTNWIAIVFNKSLEILRV